MSRLDHSDCTIQTHRVESTPAYAVALLSSGVTVEGSISKDERKVNFGVRSHDLLAF
jgi:hypothetical protein